jgi:coproporphyrinogen III oxidase-like Fe-S oxidoreductase
MAQFTARTGLNSAALEPQLTRLHEQGLLATAGDWIQASELGRRFLDSVVAEFF